MLASTNWLNVLWHIQPFDRDAVMAVSLSHVFRVIVTTSEKSMMRNEVTVDFDIFVTIAIRDDFRIAVFSHATATTADRV